MKQGDTKHLAEDRAATLEEVAAALGMTKFQVAWYERSALSKLRRSPRTRTFARALSDYLALQARVCGPAGGILKQAESQYFAEMEFPDAD